VEDEEEDNGVSRGALASKMLLYLKQGDKTNFLLSEVPGRKITWI
jgi:hypothetical protein